MIKIGITERGDPAFDQSWKSALMERGNILITKRLDLMERQGNFDFLLQNADRIILHVTVTGLAGSFLEPNTPIEMVEIGAIKRLIESGFPASHIVYRIDPIIPDVSRFWRMAKSAMLAAKDLPALGVKRARYSFVDVYPHVRTRLSKVEFPDASYLLARYADRFTVSSDIARSYASQVKEILTECGFEEVVSCGEYDGNAVGCISEQDLNLFGIPPTEATEGGFQRKSCKCLGNKVELLKNKVQCPNKCLYCYWR